MFFPFLENSFSGLHTATVIMGLVSGINATLAKHYDHMDDVHENIIAHVCEWDLGL